MSENLTLWNTLEKTDPAFTKNFDRGGFKGTAINPCYVAKKLTETFGPVGIGWRFVLEEEQYVPGHFIDPQNRAIVHVVRGHLEYLSPPVLVTAPSGECSTIRRTDCGWVSTGPQFGQTTFVGSNKYGPFTDEEAPKKSISDCLSKCAVQLGLSADIHLGIWDANKYINDPKSAAAPQAPPCPAPPVMPPKFEFARADIANAKTPAVLLESFGRATRTPELYSATDVWEVVCSLVADQFRQINLPDDPDSKGLLILLQNERARLDLGKQSAAPQQEKPKAVRKPRAAKKPVPV